MARLNHSLGVPYPLPSNKVLFTDLRYVRPGEFSYLPADEVRSPFWGFGEWPDMLWQRRNFPSGLRLVAQPPQREGPSFPWTQPWEQFAGGGALRYDEGRYRFWYECVDPATMDEQPSPSRTWGPGEANLLSYAESADGFTWEKPSLGLASWQGRKDTNIVYGGPLCPETGYHGGCVFRDPSAPPDERYKVFHLGLLSAQRLKEYQQQRPDDMDPMAVRPDLDKAWGLFGGVSPDGLIWKPLPDVFAVHHADTSNVACFDQALGRYVAYVRTWYYGRRSVGRMESPDFRRWTMPKNLVIPTPDLLPFSSVWYGPSKTVYPDTTDYHLMFTYEWRVAEDRFYVHLWSSPDGESWSYVPGGPILSPGNDGEWDGGGVVASTGLVPLSSNRVGVLCIGFRVPHKYPRRPPLSELGWATWPKGRLAALQAAEQGEFTTAALLFQGDHLLLNVRTRRVGQVLVEAVGPKGEVLPGRSFAECDPVRGDHLSRTVTWKGEPHLGHRPGDPVYFRFRLVAADLFGLEFA